MYPDKQSACKYSPKPSRGLYRFCISGIYTQIILLLFSCTSPQSKLSDEKIEVIYELIHNPVQESANAKASFTIINHGERTLGSSNWLLYFNMLPRTIIPSADTAFADIMHISGDWYKIVPRNNFILTRDSSISIYFEFDGFQIKKSDAPVGLYFVFYDQDGREKEIIPVTNYIIMPFTRPEQIKRTAYDCERLPAPQNRYREYEKINSGRTPELLPLIPTPKSFEMKENNCRIDNQFIITCDEASEPEARYLAMKLEEITGLSLDVESSYNIRKNCINLVTNGVKGEVPEAYNLEIEPGYIQISGEREGIFYGTQSLLKMIPYEIFRSPTGEFELPAMVIEDAPRFTYRGLHIDVCRNFQIKEQILKIIDLMGWYKLNTLLLYLSEDEGWRVEIEELPELTEMGSKRGHTLDESAWLHPSYGSGPFVSGLNNHGTGYYSRDDFKEIIRLAHQRHIMVIPSINLPGHARAAIKAMEVRYSRYMKKGETDKAKEYRLIDPDDSSMYLSAQYYTDNVVCVARESVYHFFETVLDDILEMYKEAEVPVNIIYTGGDEVPEGAWTGSPMCRDLLAELPGIKDPKNLQKYYLTRINTILSERNLKTAGWEELTLEKDENWNYTVNPEFVGRKVIPYAWNSLGGSQDLAYRFANTGYQVVLCPVTNFYFDLAYSNDPEEPGLYWNGFTNERDPWQIAPYNMFYTITRDAMGCLIDEEIYENMERLKPGAEKNILGLQAQLWHETIRGGKMLEYYLLPKLIGFAERCWAQAPEWEDIPRKTERELKMNAEWQNFEYTIYEEELPKLNHLNGGYNYRIPPAGAIIENGYVKMLTSNPSLTIRYELEGNNPNNDSPIYKEPIKVSGEVRFQAYDRTGKSGKISIIQP